jgi:hypothetical protein
MLLGLNFADRIKAGQASRKLFSQKYSLRTYQQLHSSSQGQAANSDGIERTWQGVIGPKIRGLLDEVRIAIAGVN